MTLRETLEERGFAAVSSLLLPDEVEHLRALAANAGRTQAVRSRGEIYAIRNLLHVVPELAEIVTAGKVQALAEDALGGRATAVRGILFDKLMKPLLLHASSAAQSPSHRRVVHIEFASAELPPGLEWLP